MKKLFLICSLYLTLISISAQTSVSSMKGLYAKPVVEEGQRNIILQNRCGNRLTLLMFKDSMSLEFVYKPNAYRRKDYRARNFSNRDNFTSLFQSFTYPQIAVDDIKEFHYDPFYTILHQSMKHGANNDLHFLNLADENAFVLSAKAPLLIRVKPHSQFSEKDGLLYEKFNDRGEDIISFIKFSGYEQNRFRKMADGSIVIQIFENEPVIVGGEENMYQVNRVLQKFADVSLSQMIQYNEKTLAPNMDKGLVYFDNPDFQQVIDINHRIVYSGIDEGGACFGALNRIYFLIWIRDGSMTSSLMARSGNPKLINLWAPFLLNNPSYTKNDNGELKPEFLQILGNRWTKSEDDGIFYAMFSLFTYFQTTGKDDLLRSGEFELLLQTLEKFLEKTWDNKQRLIVSDTWGETPLMDDPYFGYDAVNGNYEINNNHIFHGKEILNSASFYNNINTWNILKMAEVMLNQSSELKLQYQNKFVQIENQLKESLLTKFVNQKLGVYYQGFVKYKDGSTEWYDVDDNPWEFSWAQSLGPYYPDLELSVKTARYIKESWLKEEGYGYCPWNCLANKLYEYGMSSKDFVSMLQDEIDEALLLTKKFPMPGALTEYRGRVESWRALPFSAGSFFYSTSAMCLQSLPLGIAVRASNTMDSVKNFQYRLSNIQY